MTFLQLGAKLALASLYSPTRRIYHTTLVYPYQSVFGTQLFGTALDWGMIISLAKGSKSHFEDSFLFIIIKY